MTQTVLLGDVCRYVNDKVSVDGVTLESYVSTENLIADKGGLELAAKLPETGRATKFQEGDVLVSNIRPYFKKIWFANRAGGASNDVLVFRPTTKDLSQEFLFWVLANDRFFDFSTKSSGGSKMPRGDKNQIMKYKVNLPSLDRQKKIVDILGSINAKIELNRKMNETLEQMGQALFRHYFIDNPEAEKWGQIAIGKKIHPRRGKSLQSRDMREGMIPVVSGGLRPAGFHDEANTVSPVLTVSASGANAGFVALWDEPVWSADSCFIDTTITDNVYFYYLFMKARQDIIYGMQTGSGQPHIYPKHIELLEIPNTPDKEMTDFHGTVEPLFKKIHENKIEIQTLTALRDTLLPRLISGKVKL